MNAIARKPARVDWLAVILGGDQPPARAPSPRTWHPPYMPHELDLHPDRARIEATVTVSLDAAEAAFEVEWEELQGETSKVQDHLDCALFALEEIAGVEVPDTKAEMKALLEKIIETAKTAIG